jgi:hypothetical protein
MRPSYELHVGPLSATDGAPTAGPLVVVVDRDIDVPLDLARLRLADRSGIDVGDRCTVSLGLDDTAEQVFEGSVVEVRPDVTGTCVVAVGALRALANLRVAATYSNTTLGAVAQDLAGQAGVTVGEVVQGSQLPWFVVDPGRDALTHLRALAARFGADVFADRNGSLVVQSLPGAGSGAAGGGLAGAAGGGSGEARLGADVVAARGTHRPPAWDAVTVGGQSPASARGADTAPWVVPDADAPSAQRGSGDRRLVVLEPLARTKDLARDVAAGTLAFGGRRARVLEVLVTGRAAVDLGDEVTVGTAGGSSPDGLLQGTGHVRMLCHRLDARTGFTTRIAMAFPPPGPAAGP